MESWMRLFSVIFKHCVKAFFWLFSRCLRQDENEKRVGRTNYTTRRLNHKTQSRLAPVDRKDSTLASSDFLPVACINQIFLFVLPLIKDPLLHWKKWIWIESTWSHVAHIVWKLLKMSHWIFFNFGIFQQFLSNWNWPVWQHCLTASFKVFKTSHFWHF